MAIKIMENESTERAVPPYIPLLTLTNFVCKLNKSVLPPRIDSSLTQNLSGGMSGALQSTLRFLALTDKAGNVSPSLKKLVESYGTDQWKPCFGEIINRAYADIIDGLVINSATSGQLQAKFRDNGKVEGQMAEKAVRFYLAALDEAGVARSPHFRTRKARSNNAIKLRRRTPTNRSPADEPQPPPGVPGTERFQIPIPKKEPATIIVPRDLTSEDWDMLKDILGTYIKRLIVSNENDKNKAPVV